MFSRHTGTLVRSIRKSEEFEVGNGKNYLHPTKSPVFFTRSVKILVRVVYHTHNKASDLRMWETDVLPLLVLAGRGAVPVKISTGNNFPRKYQRVPQNYYKYWCLNIAENSAIQYCTGNLLGLREWYFHGCGVRIVRP